MAIALYMDHHVPRAITMGLRLRGVDVLTAYEDGANELTYACLAASGYCREEPGGGRSPSWPPCSACSRSR